MGKGDADDALHGAAREGNVDAVRSQLSENPDALNLRDRLSRTPLHLAAWAGQTEVVSLLCERNADVGAAAMDDMAAIHFACQKGHTEVVRILLAAGANGNARNRKGMTPVHFAAQGQREELTKLLIKKGANLSTTNKAGKRPLDLVPDESFRALMMHAERERRVQKEAKTKKDKPSNVGDVASYPEAKGVVETEQSSSSVSGNTQELNKDEVGRKDPAENGSEHDGREALSEDINGAIELKDDQKPAEPRKKKAKISLSHLTDDNDGVNEW